MNQTGVILKQKLSASRKLFIENLMEEPGPFDLEENQFHNVKNSCLTAHFGNFYQSCSPHEFIGFFELIVCK